MEVRVRERLIGALVLVAIVVLFVPAILRGRGGTPSEPAIPTTRRVEVPTNDAAPVPREEVLVPQPVQDAAAPLPDMNASKLPPTPPLDEPIARPPEAKPEPPAAPTAAEPPPVAKRQVTAPSVTKTPAPAPSPATMAWAVQLGAFSNRAKAEELVAELKKRRYAAFILEYRATGQVLYRVRVGPEQERARAEEIAARLAKDGFQPVVARHP